jgi:hypothetical protein
MNAEMLADSDARNEWGLPQIEVTASPLSAQHTQIDASNRKNDALPWVVLVAIVACSMGGAALGLSIGSRDIANEAKRIADRETRLQRLELDEVKVALQTQGIKVHEGSTP